MTRPSILVCYAGGTIGMVPSEQGMVSGADIAGFLDRLVVERGLAVDVTLFEFAQLIDSANATPKDWQAIVDAVRAGRHRYDGFVILHGTDTMAYTTSALAFALTDLGKPVIVTGAQRSIVEEGSDAPGNVAGALAAAGVPRLMGVWLFFDGVLLPGVRATKVSSYSPRGFDAPNAPGLTTLSGEGWVWADPPEPGCGWADAAPYTRRDVVVLSFAPGLTASRLRAMLTPAPEAVLLWAYGSGQGPSAEPGFAEVLADLVAAGTPVAVASQCVQAEVDLSRYAAGDLLRRSGAFGVGDATTEAAYAKLVFLLCQSVPAADFPQWFGTNVAGEISLSS